MTPPIEQCAAHSGVAKGLETLEEFRERQEGRGGVNERIFERLDKINNKLSWITGAAFGIGFILGLLANQIKLH